MIVYDYNNTCKLKLFQFFLLKKGFLEVAGKCFEVSHGLPSAAHWRSEIHAYHNGKGKAAVFNVHSLSLCLLNVLLK